MKSRADAGSEEAAPSTTRPSTRRTFASTGDALVAFQETKKALAE
jgi:hypothetical protein